MKVRISPQGGAIWVKLTNPGPIDYGCDCTYCRTHSEEPTWDTLVIPVDKKGRPTGDGFCIHAPDFWAAQAR